MMTGEELRQWRAENGFTSREKLASAVGVCPATIKRYEKNIISPPKTFELALKSLRA